MSVISKLFHKWVTWCTSPLLLHANFVIWCVVLESREDIVDEQEMENYLVCVMALQRLMQSERSLMVGIVPLQHQHQVFEIIIRDAMDMVVQDGEVLVMKLRKKQIQEVLVIFVFINYFHLISFLEQVFPLSYIVVFECSYDLYFNRNILLC